MSLASYALAITNNANKAGAYMKLKRMLSRETKDGWYLRVAIVWLDKLMFSWIQTNDRRRLKGSV